MGEQVDDAAPGGRTGRVLTSVLAALTAVALALTVTATWIARTAFDTDRFVALVEPAVTSDVVLGVVGDRVTDSTLEVLAVEERLDELLGGVQRSLTDALTEALGLPPRAQDLVGNALDDTGLSLLAAPISTAVEERVAGAVDDVLTSDEFQALVVDAVDGAHRRAVLLLRGELDELPAVVVEDGVVAVDLRPLVGRVLSELRPDFLDGIGLPDILGGSDPDDPVTVLEAVARATGVELDPSFGRIPVMDQSELEELQLLVRGMERARWAMVVATLLLAVVTLAVAPDRRRAVRDVALAAVVGSGLAVVLVERLVDRLAAFGTTPDEQAAILAVAATTLGSLRDQLALVLVVAAVVVVVLHLRTRPRWLHALRNAIRPAAA